MKKIILTGGGTAGHVTPNIALLPRLKELGYEIEYIGSYEGIEKKLIEAQGIPYHGIATGKLRRYFDLKNFTDPFRVIKGMAQAHQLLKSLKPNVVFSKGGFVSVPVVRAAHSLKIPVIIHESDLTPGLANKLAFPAATKICCNFPETLSYLPENKAVLSGSPIRQELFEGDRERGLGFTGLSGDKDVLLIIGGSLGSVAVNTAIRRILPQLLERFNVVHLCGKGNQDASLEGLDGYRQYEYIQKELPDFFAMADVVVSRAGANSICELLALRKPALLIPLSAAASRGDQLLNAASFQKQGFCEVLQEEELSDERLLETINRVCDHRQSYIDAMSLSPVGDPIKVITDLIVELS